MAISIRAEKKEKWFVSVTERLYSDDLVELEKGMRLLLDERIPYTVSFPKNPKYNGRIIELHHETERPSLEAAKKLVESLLFYKAQFGFLPEEVRQQ